VKINGGKMYKTEIIKCTYNIAKRAKLIEEKCNEMFKEGWEIVSVSGTTVHGAILVFKKITK
jgi:hypothetical protein